MAIHDTVSCANRRDFLRLAGGSAVLLATMPFAAFAAGPPAKIATIGSGHIGSTLGSLWVKAGHEVMFSSRHPEELKALVDGLGAAAHAGTVEQAVAFGQVVLLAVPYSAMPQIGHDFAAQLATKALVLDASNPMVARDGEIATKAREMGAGLYSAQLFPGARLVRAFNAINYMKLAEDAQRQGERVAMPMAGDDAGALALASELVREIDLEPVVIGGLAAGKNLIPGTPLAGEHTADEVRKIAATLN
ncbi:MAG: NADPH-dependent F420 reductase [Alphaproteobacteria bacterium]